MSAGRLEEQQRHNLQISMVPCTVDYSVKSDTKRDICNNKYVDFRLLYRQLRHEQEVDTTPYTDHQGVIRVPPPKIDDFICGNRSSSSFRFK